METKNIIGFLLTCLVLTNLASAILINADYVTTYPGEEADVSIEVENTEGFDIEDVSVSLILDEVPFVSVGSSEKEIDDLEDDDDDSASFSLKASSDITPGDYDIPYVVKYSEEGNETFIEKIGSFGLRVSARTDLDFAVETKNAIVGQQGRIGLEIINRGLGDLKSVSVDIFPQGYELLSKETVFLGRVDAEDSEVVNYDVLFELKSATLSAKITYKDFDNNEQSETVSLPMKVYTYEEARELGMVSTSNTIWYVVGAIILIIVWFVWRRFRKRKKKQ